MVKKYTFTVNQESYFNESSIHDLFNGYNVEVINYDVSDVQESYKAFEFSDGRKVPFYTALSGVSAINNMVAMGIYDFNFDLDLVEEYDISETEYNRLTETMVRTYDWIPNCDTSTYFIFMKGDVPVHFLSTYKNPKNEREEIIVDEKMREECPNDIDYDYVLTNTNISGITDTMVRNINYIPESGSYTYYKLLKDGAIVGTMATKKMLIGKAEIHWYANKLEKPEFDAYEVLNSYDEYQTAKTGVIYGETKEYIITFDSSVTFKGRTGLIINIKSHYDLPNAPTEFVHNHLGNLDNDFDTSVPIINIQLVVTESVIEEEIE